MKWWAETTQWENNIRNGIYLLDDSKSKMYAYRPSERDPIKVFREPIRIDTRGRKFKISSVQWRTGVAAEVPAGRVWKVSGSKGDQYQVTEHNGEWSCSCSGFKFRSNCKHVTQLQQEQQ